MLASAGRAKTIFDKAFWIVVIGAVATDFGKVTGETGVLTMGDMPMITDPFTHENLPRVGTCRAGMYC